MTISDNKPRPNPPSAKDYKPSRCVFNYYIDCCRHDGCTKCGWYPPVEDKRKALIRQKMPPAESSRQGGGEMEPQAS